MKKFCLVCFCSGAISLSLQAESTLNHTARTTDDPIDVSSDGFSDMHGLPVNLHLDRNSLADGRSFSDHRQLNSSKNDLRDQLGDNGAGVFDHQNSEHHAGGFQVNASRGDFENEHGELDSERVTVSQAVPEPSSVFLLIGGAAIVGGTFLRRRLCRK